MTQFQSLSTKKAKKTAFQTKNQLKTNDGLINKKIMIIFKK